jgi:glyoxylase-like metal-dependent hydrolase (beta-lactamase superfamily II)
VNRGDEGHPGEDEHPEAIGLGLFEIPTVYRGRINTSYYVESEDSGVLVDAGDRSSVVERIVPFLQSRPTLPRLTVVSTHCDLDHIGGNGTLRRLIPAINFQCHPLERARVEDLKRTLRERTFEFASEGIDPDLDLIRWIDGNIELTSVDRTLEDGDPVELDSRNLIAIHTPGHTEGSLSLFDSETGALCIGDALLGRGIPDRDGKPLLPPTYRHVAWYRATIDRIRNLAPARLLTSHLGVLSGADIQRLLNDSVDFTDELEHLVSRALAEAPKPLTLLDLADTLVPHVGDWPAPRRRAIAYPIAGHLEDLESRSLVQRESGGVHSNWRWID